MDHNGKGIARSLNREKFYIPRNLSESYDDDVLRFRISEEDVKSRFMIDTPPSSQISTQEKHHTNTITSILLIRLFNQYFVLRVLLSLEGNPYPMLATTVMKDRSMY
jgi:hypothetical protein